MYCFDHRDDRLLKLRWKRETLLLFFVFLFFLFFVSFGGFSVHYRPQVSDNAHRHVEAHMRRNIPSDTPGVSIHDVTGALAQINIQGYATLPP
jgi:hypothetical protein